MNATLPVPRERALPAPLAPPIQVPGAGPSRRDAVAILFRHKGKITAFALAVLLAAAVRMAQQPRTYTSEALLLVRQGRESVSLDPTATTGEVIPMNRDWDSEVNSELAILNAHTLVEGVIDRIGPNAVAETEPDLLQRLTGGGSTATADVSRAYAARQLSRGLAVQAIPKSEVIQLSCTLGTRRAARDSLAALLDAYYEKRAEAHRTAGSLAFFQKQESEFGEKLRAAESALTTRKSAMGATDLAAMNSNVEERRAVLRRRGDELQIELDTAQARQAALREQLSVVLGSPKLVPPETIKGLKASLQSAETDVQARLASVETLQAQLRDALGDAQRLNEAGDELRTLQRNVEILERDYHRYSQRMEEARIDDALETEKISNIGVIQQPTVPTGPNPTQQRLILLLAAMLALGGSVGIAFLADCMDHTVRRPEDLEEKLGIRLLANVPKLRRCRLKPRRLRRDSRSPGHEILPAAPRTAAAFCALARRTLSAARGRTSATPLLIGVTGCFHGEGASTVAMHLSLALAGSSDLSGGVLLVEPVPSRSGALPFLQNTRGPRATRFEAGSKGRTSAVEQNLYSIGSGDDEEISEVLPTPEDLVYHARNCGAAVAVFDLPPVFDGGIAERLAPRLDGVVLVAESERTRWQTLRAAQRTLHEAGAQIFGGVLNKRRFHVPSWLYCRL